MKASVVFFPAGQPFPPSPLREPSFKGASRRAICPGLERALFYGPLEGLCFLTRLHYPQSVFFSALLQRGRPHSGRSLVPSFLLHLYARLEPVPLRKSGLAGAVFSISARFLSFLPLHFSSPGILTGPERNAFFYGCPQLLLNTRKHGLTPRIVCPDWLISPTWSFSLCLELALLFIILFLCVFPFSLASKESAFLPIPPLTFSPPLSIPLS